LGPFTSTPIYTEDYSMAWFPPIIHLARMTSLGVYILMEDFVLYHSLWDAESMNGQDAEELLNLVPKRHLLLASPRREPACARQLTGSSNFNLIWFTGGMEILSEGARE